MQRCALWRQVVLALALVQAAVVQRPAAGRMVAVLVWVAVARAAAAVAVLGPAVVAVVLLVRAAAMTAAGTAPGVLAWLGTRRVVMMVTMSMGILQTAWALWGRRCLWRR